jgi:hypothetical protein
LLATFGDALQLVGYDYAIGSAISAGELPATVTTYWRALRPLDTDYTFAFFFTREDGAIVGQFADPTATSQWYPTSRWGTGELVRIELPPLPIGRLHDVMVTVTTGKADPISSEGRLLPSTGGGARLDLVQEGTLLKLFSFP